MPSTPIQPLRRVVVVGATHGNELAGEWLVRRITSQTRLAAWPSIKSLEAVVGNPAAFAASRRFVDEDLNRQFGRALGDAAGGDTCERARAREINAEFGPKAAPGAGAADFIVDLHTTTANMGITYITGDYSPLGLAAAAWCQHALERRVSAGELPPVNILHEAHSKESCPYLCSVGRHGLMVEIGPVPQGVLRHDVCSWAEAAVSTMLDFIQAFNASIGGGPKRVVVNKDHGVFPVPVASDGTREALFHRAFQGQDFRELRKGDPIFMFIDGEVVAYDGRFGDTVFPVFINEAAYYQSELGLGFGVTKREMMDVPPFIVDAPALARL